MQEKWDSMTRRWRDNKALIQLVRLFLIDEVSKLGTHIHTHTCLNKARKSCTGTQIHMQYREQDSDETLCNIAHTYICTHLHSMYT